MVFARPSGFRSELDLGTTPAESEAVDCPGAGRQSVPIYQDAAVSGCFGFGKRVERSSCQKGGAFEFSCEARPFLVRFDEGNLFSRKFHFPYPGRTCFISSMTTLSPDGCRRRMAVRSSEPAWPRPETAAANDPFWAVRRPPLEALVKARGGMDGRSSKEGHRSEFTRPRPLSGTGDAGQVFAPFFQDGSPRMTAISPKPNACGLGKWRRAARSNF